MQGHDKDRTEIALVLQCRSFIKRESKTGRLSRVCNTYLCGEGISVTTLLTNPPPWVEKRLILLDGKANSEIHSRASRLFLGDFPRLVHCHDEWGSDREWDERHTQQEPRSHHRVTNYHSRL